MEELLLNRWVVTSIFSVAVIGFAVCWFGVIIALVTALGNKKWLWGIAIFFLGPITGIPYTIFSKEAIYSKSLMIKGVLLIIPGLVMFIFKFELLRGHSFL